MPNPAHEIHMAEEQGFEELSDQEKLQVAQHLLLQSPPGQFDDVLSGTFACQF